MSYLQCPLCEVGPALICGIELAEVYDGVSFWQCQACGYTWSRWTGDQVPNFDRLTHEEKVNLAREQRKKAYEVDNEHD